MPDAPELDAVADEITCWKYIAPAKLAKFRCADGLLNEFKMMWELRERFPLHFLLFKQMACHLPHEANVEQYFSRAGNLSDPNIDPAYLGVLVMVSANKSRFKPTVKTIMERYYKKYRGKGGIKPGEAGDDPLLSGGAGPSSAAPAPAPAPA